MFDFGIKDFIDIFLVAVMLYYIYRLMKESRSLNVFIGIIVFILVWLFVSGILEMRLLGSIMDKLVSVGVLTVIILFQDDIRKFLYNLGAHQRVRSLTRLFRSSGKKEAEADKATIMPIVMANINQRLIENIFFKNSPLHDGAMIIRRKRICAAGCILPVSHTVNIPKELGLRHRAALGISQESDALAIICSEETGRISVAMHGEFQLRLSAEQLESLLSKEILL